MGNFVSKVSENIDVIFDRVARSFMLMGKHTSMPRRADVYNLFPNDRKLEIVTPAADRFPQQSCVLKYNDTVNKHLDRCAPLCERKVLTRRCNLIK